MTTQWTCWLCDAAFQSVVYGHRPDGTPRYLAPGWAVCQACKLQHGPFSDTEKHLVGGMREDARAETLRALIKGRRPIVPVPNPADAAPPGYAGFIATLADLFLSDSPRSIRQWHAFCKRDARCQSWQESSACLLFLIPRARFHNGLAAIYPEHLLPYVRDWLQHPGRSTPCTTPSPACASPATPSAASPTPFSWTTSAHATRPIT